MSTIKGPRTIKFYVTVTVTDLYNKYRAQNIGGVVANNDTCIRKIQLKPLFKEQTRIINKPTNSADKSYKNIYHIQIILDHQQLSFTTQTSKRIAKVNFLNHKRKQ